MDWFHCSPFKEKKGGNAKAYSWMGGLRAAPWSISHVIRNQQDVSKNKKLVCIAIFVDDPRLSQYCQYVIYGSAYCNAVHPVVS
jgi:hypothetical protein